MKICIAVLFILQISMHLPAIAQNCQCAENFVTLTEMLAIDYPGFNDKTKTPRYKFLKDSLLKETQRAEDLYTCYTILRNLTLFFKDPHLSLNINNVPENKQRLKEMFSQVRSETFSKTLLADSNSIPIEGIWEIKNQGTEYRVKIGKDNTGNFIGTIVNSDSIFWNAGQTKFLIVERSKNYYKIIFYLRDHTPFLVTAKYEPAGVLDLKNFGLWQRVLDNQINMATRDSIISAKRSIYVKSLDDTTTYLRIPSLAASNITKLDSITRICDKQLQKKTLIIDLRSNGGGSTVVSDALLKYIYDKPISYEGSSFLNSEKNAEDIEIISSRPEYKSVYEDVLKEKINLIKHSPPNALVVFSNPRTESLDSIYSSPEQVYILVDNVSASATEYFLLEARQSNKVKIVGQNTRGAIDYTDIGLPRILPCGLFYLQTPMIRSDRVNRIKLDNVGVVPDIQVPENEDALDFLIKALKHD